MSAPGEDESAAAVQRFVSHWELVQFVRIPKHHSEHPANHFVIQSEFGGGRVTRMLRKSEKPAV